MFNILSLNTPSSSDFLLGDHAPLFFPVALPLAHSILKVIPFVEGKLHSNYILLYFTLIGGE